MNINDLIKEISNINSIHQVSMEKPDGTISNKFMIAFKKGEPIELPSVFSNEDAGLLIKSFLLDRKYEATIEGKERAIADGAIVRYDGDNPEDVEKYNAFLTQEKTNALLDDDFKRKGAEFSKNKPAKPKSKKEPEENKTALDSIIDHLATQDKHKGKLDLKLREVNQGRLTRFFFDNALSKKMKLQRNSLKTQIRNLKEDIKDEQAYLKEVCTFDYDLVKKFLRDSLAIVDGVEYDYKDMELYYTTMVSTGKYTTTSTHYYDVCFISTKSLVNRMGILFNQGKFDETDTDEMDKLKRTVRGRHILLQHDSKKEFNLFDINNNRIDRDITENYPFMENIVVDLINNRIENPRKSQGDVMKMTLRNLREQYSSKSNNNKKLTI